MDTVPLKPERMAQLEEYARRHGQDPATVLDEALGSYLEWERQEYEETVDAVVEAYEDVKAERTRPAADFLEGLREKHGFPR
jgi:hypothetical protein